MISHCLIRDGLDRNLGSAGAHDQASDPVRRGGRRANKAAAVLTSGATTCGAPRSASAMSRATKSPIARGTAGAPGTRVRRSLAGQRRTGGVPGKQGLPRREGVHALRPGTGEHGRRLLQAGAVGVPDPVSVDGPEAASRGVVTGVKQSSRFGPPSPANTLAAAAGHMTGGSGDFGLDPGAQPWLPGQRSDLNEARISAAKRSGCSQAAKWPPRSSRL